MFPAHLFSYRFRVMPDDELNELTQDIKRNGMCQPVWLNTKGVLPSGPDCGRANRRQRKGPAAAAALAQPP
jgi:hypothetical protein